MREEQKTSGSGPAEVPGEKELHELEQLEGELRQRMKAYTARVPSQTSTEKLIASLQPEFERLKPAAEDIILNAAAPLIKPSLLRQCFRLAGTYGKGYWVVSAVIFAMLTLISSVLGTSITGRNDLFSAVVPLFMLTCAVYSYRSWNAEMRMVESVTPYPPALQLLCRLLVVVTMNLAYGLAGSLYLQITVDSFGMLPFLLKWLSGMFLVGGVLAVVTFWKGTKAGLAASLAVWLLWNTGWGIYVGRSVTRLDPDFIFGLQLMAMAAGCALFVWAYRRSMSIRWLKG